MKPDARNSRRRPARRAGTDLTFPLAAILATLLFLAAYSNSLHNSFHFDDSHVIVDNLFIRSLANIPHFFTDAQTFSALQQNATYRPLVSLTLAWDYRLAGRLDPFWFHVTQLTLLAATGVMLFLLYRSLFESAGARHWSRWPALFAAALFCIHTGNTQTANYISARSELLSSLGVLGGFLMYIFVPEWRRYYLYLLPVIAGAFAKTPAVMFAPLLLAYMLFIERQLSLGDLFTRRAWRDVRGALLEAAPAFVVGGLLYKFVESMNPPGQTYGGAGRMQYLETQAWVWVRYVRLFFVPTGLTADSDLRGVTTWADPRFVAGVLLLAVSLLAIWRTSRTRELRPVAFGIAWFWIALIPSSSIFPLAETTNDHRVFFPFMGLTAAVVWWVWIEVARRLSPSGRRRSTELVTATVLVVLGAHALATHRRNRVWLNEETLWADVVSKSPNNGRGLMNYGLTQMRQGRFTEARDLFMRAYELAPNYAVLHVNIAIVTNAMGDTAKAEEWFKRALSTNPTYAAAHMFYGNWLTQHGRAGEAVVEMERALELSTADLGVRHTLIQLYAAAGDTAKLRSLVRQTLELDRSDQAALDYSDGISTLQSGTSREWFQRGLNHARSGLYLLAAASYRIAAAKDSTNADVWNNLGWTLGKLGFFSQAAPALENAIRLRPGYTLARNNLAWVKGRIPATP